MVVKSFRMGMVVFALGASLVGWRGDARTASGFGSDTLLGTVDPGSSAVDVDNDKTISTHLHSAKGLQLDDPFLFSFFSGWQQEKMLPRDVNAWALTLLQGKTEAAAHLWSVVKPQLPAGFETTAQIANLYTLWKLKLPQTFFSTWTEVMARPDYLQNRTAEALEQTVAPGFDSWLVDNAIQWEPSDRDVISRIAKRKSGLYVTLMAWLALRRQTEGRPLLDELPVDHRLKIPLAQTVALALAREKDLKGVGAVLKRHMEPAIEATHNPEALSAHFLQVARLLFQAGALDEAQVFYEKIPSGSLSFLTAREELVWIGLLKGETSRLRGDLATLKTHLFEKVFAPDVYVVRAISNLKLCFYDEAEKDIRTFTERSGGWLREIRTALQSEDPTPTDAARQDDSDFYGRQAGAALLARKKEAESLLVFGANSIGVSLPAVGVQSHWQHAHRKMLGAVEVAKKNRAHEIHRQWQNRKAVLAEAIRKMQFVKIEWQNQVRSLSLKPTPNPTPQASASGSVTVKAELAAGNADHEMSFPFDGTAWPDELFRLRSAAQSRCLAGGNP